MPKVTRIPKIDVTISANAAFVPKLGVFLQKNVLQKWLMLAQWLPFRNDIFLDSSAFLA